MGDLLSHLPDESSLPWLFSYWVICWFTNEKICHFLCFLVKWHAPCPSYLVIRLFSKLHMGDSLSHLTDEPSLPWLFSYWVICWFRYEQICNFIVGIRSQWRWFHLRESMAYNKRRFGSIIFVSRSPVLRDFSASVLWSCLLTVGRLKWQADDIPVWGFSLPSLPTTGDGSYYNYYWTGSPQHSLR